MKEEKKKHSDCSHAFSGIAQKMRDIAPQLDLKDEKTRQIIIDK